MLAAKKDKRDREDAEHLKIDDTLNCTPVGGKSVCSDMGTFTMKLYIGVLPPAVPKKKVSTVKKAKVSAKTKA